MPSKLELVPVGSITPLSHQNIVPHFLDIWLLGDRLTLFQLVYQLAIRKRPNPNNAALPAGEKFFAVRRDT